MVSSDVRHRQSLVQTLEEISLSLYMGGFISSQRGRYWGQIWGGPGCQSSAARRGRVSCDAKKEETFHMDYGHQDE
jgi:hypothetical protein